MSIPQHLDLLLRFDRGLKLKEVIRAVVDESTTVLDAGCGTGVLSVMAGLAGAKRVVGLDTHQIELATALVAENGLSERVVVRRADLADLTLAPGEPPFDVVIGMVYLNDPRRDEAQTRMMQNLLSRVLSQRGQCIPDRVEYSAMPLEWPGQDVTTHEDRLRRAVADLEGRYGVRFQSLLAASGMGIDGRCFPRRRPDGSLEREGVRVLGPEVSFVSVDFRRGRSAYPDTVVLPCTASGVLTTVLWTQRLWFEEALLFANESVSWVMEPPGVSSGNETILSIDESWRLTNTLRVREVRS